MAARKGYLVTVDGAALHGQDVWAVCDSALKAATKVSCETVGFVLPVDLPAGIAMLDWVEGWLKRMAKQGRAFVVVAEDPAQLQCLELSHPEQNLAFFGSVEQWYTRFPVEEDEVDGVDGVDDERYLPEEPPEEKPTPAGIEDRPVDQAGPVSKIGVRVDTAGEYACAGCGLTRMYMKGDTVGGCENPECQHPDWGWKFVFELF